MDFLDECQSNACLAKILNVCLFIGGELDIGLSDVLAFFSGADQVPPLGFEHTATLSFHRGQEVLPTASTCTLELTLPILHLEYSSFRRFMHTGLREHGGFGRV